MGTTASHGEGESERSQVSSPVVVVEILLEDERASEMEARWKSKMTASKSHIKNCVKPPSSHHLLHCRSDSEEVLKKSERSNTPTQGSLGLMRVRAALKTLKGLAAGGLACNL